MFPAMRPASPGPDVRRSVTRQPARRSVRNATASACRRFGEPATGLKITAVRGGIVDRLRVARASGIVMVM
jgi:hypothetical protein